MNRIDPSKNNIRQVDFPLGRSDDENPTTPQARIKRWQSKLLDLTLRNRLLNFKDGKQTIPFQCPDVPELENLLAGGKNMRVISLDHSLEEENRLGNYESAQDLRETDPDKYKEFPRQYLKEKKICVPQLTKEEMIARLTTLFRKAKSDVAEGGTNTLFLAAGFLYWKQKPTDSRTIRSPLLLLPVELTRQRATEIFHLQHHDDDVRINLTLLELLRQDFDIQVPALEGELPTDHKGLDVEQIFRLMSDAISAAPTMKMIEELALSTFSFAKYLMWKDLVDRTDSLRQNRFVKHLIDTPGERYRSTNTNNMPKPSEMDKRYRPGDLVTPLPADSSQLAAIASAGDGHDMVIIGPPGTGKSQTIANVIAHCLAKKKTVLFVAEKLAALDVVHRRLKAHNLGDFCLELHSNKADRRSVLKQLEAAWDRAATDNDQKWVEVTYELQIKRKELNAYVESLHESGTHGYSVFKAIGIVSDNTSGAGKPAFELEFPALDTHDKESFKNLLEEVKKLSEAFSGIRSLNGLESITQSDWSIIWQQRLLKDADSLHKATAELHRVANDLASSFGQQTQNEISFEQLENLCRFAEAFEQLENLRRFTEVFEQLENLRRSAEAFEQLENLRRFAEAFEQLENLRRFAEAFEQLENLRRFAEAFEQLENLCRFAETTVGISRENYPLEVYENLDQLRTGLNDLEARISAVRNAEGKLSAHYAYNQVLQIPISELDQSWREHSAKFWPFSWFGKRRIAKILQSYTKKGKADPGRDLELLASIVSQLKEIKNSNLHELPQFRGIDTNIEDLRTYLDNASELRDAIDDLKQTLTETATLIKKGKANPGRDLELLASIASQLKEIKNSNLHELSQFRGIDTNIEDLRTYLDNASEFRDVIDDLKQTLTDTATLIERMESLLAEGARKEYDAAWIAYCKTADGKPQKYNPHLLQNEISKVIEYLRTYLNNASEFRDAIDDLKQTLTDTATLIKKGKTNPGRDLELLASIASQLKEIKNSDLHELPQFRGIDTNIEDLRTYLDNASEFRDAIDDLKQTLTDTTTLIERIESLLPEKGCLEDIAKQAVELIGSRKEYDTAWIAYCKTAGGKPQSTTLTLLQNEISKIVESVQENPKIISAWCRWIAAQTQIDERRQRVMEVHYYGGRRQGRAMAEHYGLRKLTKALITGSLEPEHVETAFLKAYFSWWLPLAIDSKSELRKFASWEHMDTIKKFRDLTTDWEELAPDQVRRVTAQNLLPKQLVSKNSELGRLRHQLGLKRPSKSIRNLISEMPTEFPRLVPCVLMSPLSIAQYLPTQALFDLVIFDEASQITTWDAIGAISRGRQSIIVGDPKQLPPTNFFGRITYEEDEDIEEYEQDEESILDEASTAGLPPVDLKWHYRSRDEALIAFSNHRYYKDSLITFPSPRRDVKAVQFHKIDGVYRRGTSRTNDEEARAIVKLIIERLQRGLKIPQDERTTIGVVTFNMQQRDRILDLLDNERLRNPALEWYFDDDREEPLIVKNLETIQGDERDVLMFSVTFGPDKAGKMLMNFGALNQDGGERRLNVAVTRARQELHVFTSITADKIDLSRTNAIGVRDLKNFLDYAKRGPNALPARDEGSMGDAESPFETAVEDALKEKGWDVRNQIGVAGYRIDLGILHPDSSGAYLAGIECDGATYHRSAVARDRDQIRESVLRNLGWEILRIWSTDWYLDPRGSCKQVDEKLNRILDVSLVNNADANRVQSGYDESCLDEDDEILTSNGSSDDSSVNSFDSDSSVNNADVNRVQSGYDESCLDENDETLTSNGSSDGSSVNSFDSDSSDDDLSGDNLSGQPPFTETADRKDVLKDSTEVLDPEQFFRPTYTPVLESLVTGIVKSESPILADSLVRTVANKHGWKRAIRRIRERVFACLGNVEVKNEGDRRFLWWPGTFAESVPYRGRQGRDLRDISQSEIAGLIDKNPECLHAEDPVRELANLLEVSRLTGVTRNYLHECISRSKHQN